MIDDNVQEEDVLDEDDECAVATSPGNNADSIEEIQRHISPHLLELYDVYSYRHAAALIKNSFPIQWGEIEHALLNFKMTTFDFASPGGNESAIPKKLSAMLRPKEWFETRINGDLVIKVAEYTEDTLPNGKIKKRLIPEKASIVLEKYIDGHKIDYVKGQVALDMEWNSKDQTYDRDLVAFKMFHECGIISVAVLITRSQKLDDVFKIIPKRNKAGEIAYNKKGEPISCMGKFGASTTQMGKLLYRLNTGRHGGCPVLVFGILPTVITDYSPTR